MILLIFYLGTASSDTSNNPIPTAQGLRITGQQYLTVSDKWVSSSSGISIYIWIYYRSGEIGNFAQIGIDVIFFIVNLNVLNHIIKQENNINNLFSLSIKTTFKVILYNII